MEITDKQVKALHVWCRLCERYLNSVMYYRFKSMGGTTKWIEGDFKYYIYKPFLKVYKGKTSTMDQDSVEPSDICLALSGHFATEWQLQLPEWPNIRG